MTVPFMEAYVKLLIKTCHRRGVHAMGGMAAQIPIKDNEEANKKAMAGVYADKLREVRAGHEYVFSVRLSRENFTNGLYSGTWYAWIPRVI